MAGDPIERWWQDEEHRLVLAGMWASATKRAAPTSTSATPTTTIASLSDVTPPRRPAGGLPPLAATTMEAAQARTVPFPERPAPDEPGPLIPEPQEPEPGREEPDDPEPVVPEQPDVPLVPARARMLTPCSGG